MPPIPKPIVLLILDGWGLAPPGAGNAIASSNTMNMDRFLHEMPHTKLEAAGEAVGLPHGEDGNTETGHLNIGAGSIILQDLPRINASIADGSFFDNQAFLEAVKHSNNNNSTLHLMGLLGAGGVHSNIEHIFALIHLAKINTVKNLALHVFTDGRDSPPTSALSYISQLKEKLNNSGIGKIATVMGRFYAMDRDNRWERTQKAYLALTEGKGNIAKNPEDAINSSYDSGKTDEFIEPTVIVDDNNQPISLIRKNDSVIFFNFRVDRPRQLTKAFVLPNLESAADKKSQFDPYTIKYFKKHIAYPELQTKPFQRKEKIKNLLFVTMTEYERGLPITVAFPNKKIIEPFGKVISDHGLKQLRIAETEKERFVTYYFNGMREDPFSNEDRIIIPSAKVNTYDLYPQMSAPEITETINEKVSSGIYDVFIVNYANPDMVGHTGNLQATIDACQVVDGCVNEVVEKVLTIGGAVLITGDHGNAEELLNPKTGDVDTEHSIFPVPLILITNIEPYKNCSLSPGILADIAPTMLQMLHIQKPNTMTGRSLIKL